MVRYGMIGFGGIAENRLAKEGFACDRGRFQPLEEAALVGVTDVNPARRAAAEALGLAWYDSADALLAGPGIDAVVVATNNRTHYPVASKAIRAGKHALVEKPLAPTSAEAAALVAEAETAGLSLAVDHMMVHNVLNEKARELVAGGALGAVNDACFHMQFAYGYEPAEASSWRCSRIEEMGGPIGDVASHCFYVMEFVLGTPIRAVRATYFPKAMGIAVEDGAVVYCDLADGRTASALVSFCDRRGGALGTLGNLGFELYGEKAALRSYGTMFQLSGFTDEPYRIRLELDTAEGVQTFHAESPADIYQGVVKAHAASIEHGPRMTGLDGLHNVRLCEAAHASAQSGGKTMVAE